VSAPPAEDTHQAKIVAVSTSRGAAARFIQVQIPRMTGAALALLLVLGSSGAVEVRHAIGSLHGFPSMSDDAGRVIADGELTQELRGERLAVQVRWAFQDGRKVVETDVFRVGAELTQEQFSWVESRGGEERRRFEIDFETGRALALTRGEKGDVSREEAKLDLAGRAFAGYGTALAVSHMPFDAAGWKGAITFVAFTPKPRAVKLEVKLDGEERIRVAGRAIVCDRLTLHPAIPFPLSLFAHAADAHLWFTHGAPPALVRAQQNLAEKDDPQVVIDVIPRGPAHTPPSARRQPQAR